MIVLLVTIMLFGILTIIFFYNSTIQKEINKSKLDLACFSALQTFISKKISFTNSELFIKIDSINVSISPSYKGLFSEIVVTAKDNNDSSKIKYLLADKIDEQFQFGLIISKENLRASVAGNTKINGDLLLTSDKIKIGRISGKSTASRDFQNGKIIVQENINPKLFNENLILQQFSKNTSDSIIYKFIDGNFELNEYTFSDLTNIPNINVSQNLILSGKLTSLKNVKLNFSVYGEVVISSSTYSNIDLNIRTDSSITIESNSQLENIILSAEKKIIIKEGSEFKNIQLFSKKGIETTGVQFKYPSILALYSDLSEETNLKNEIKINSSIINGAILLVNSTTGLSNNKNIIEIDDVSTVQGLVYSENYATISGNIYGLIYTYAFWYYKEPTEYINWLVDVKIDREKLDKDFLIPVGFEKTDDFRILKQTWIN
ncbi:MAG: hypothetical protein IPK06_09795 [Ignavibacteriae bacterium]|nr:hypothetical protein [Ignavibacteriota bacterium]